MKPALKLVDADYAKRVVPSERDLPASPEIRGYHAVYRSGEVNRCPACGRSHWLIGRISAECGFCATAIPLEIG